MRAALAAAVLSLLAFVGCGNDGPPAEEATLMVVDHAEIALEKMRHYPDEGYDNIVEVQDEFGEWREVEGTVQLIAGTHRLRAYAVDRFAGPKLRHHEPCVENVAVEDAVLAWVSRDYAGSCEIEIDPQLCPAYGEKADEDLLRERAERAFVGRRFEEASASAAAAGCRLVAAQIDGVGQPLTREFDPSRIHVNVHRGEVQKVLGFG